MAFVRIPSFQQSIPVVDSSGRFTPAALRSLNDAFRVLADALNTLAQIPEIQAALENLNDATEAAQAAATAAQQAADAAGMNTEAQQKEQSLQSSYIDPSSVLSATPDLITIAPHIRYYPQVTGTPLAVPVNGASITSSAPGTVAYVIYTDPNRTGGNVPYQVVTQPPTQTGDTHVVGAVVIPTVGVVDGGEGPVRPGFVRPRENQQIE